MDTLRFDGRVAIVTGAGGGLGRSYALLLAARGAKVVVNDLGTNLHGQGKSSNSTDEVVQEIVTSGGEAVADYNSVVEGERIIQTALDSYGRLDILINNAGFIRDKSFLRLSDADWDSIQEVHLKGSFKTTQAAFALFKKQKYGRIIVTSSTSGLYGNFGQANYAAAKVGLIGLSNTLTIEGAQYNIHCNVIAPGAATRMTRPVVDDDMFIQMNPDYIAPVVAYLCHESCNESGKILETYGGWVKMVKFIRGLGCNLRDAKTDSVSIESVRDNWQKIENMKGAEFVEAGHIVTQAHLSNTVSTFKFDYEQIILYSLSVGASLERPNEFKFIYEKHSEFEPLPTFFIVPTLQMISGDSLNVIPGRTANFQEMVQGEHYLEVFGDLPKEGTLTTTFKVVDVLDKSSGAVIVVNLKTYYKEQLIVLNQFAVFALGYGNFGGPREGTSLVKHVPVPKRKPDFSVVHKTSIDQAAFYRLSGDFNQLHIDPEFSKLAGFDKPLLHGLCTLGISVRIILGTLANYDCSLFKCVKARFSSPVLPGQTLSINMWIENSRVHFETVNVDTKNVAVSGAYVDLKAIKINSNI